MNDLLCNPRKVHVLFPRRILTHINNHSHFSNRSSKS
jgi:hypothetical protein